MKLALKTSSSAICLKSLFARGLMFSTLTSVLSVQALFSPAMADQANAVTALPMAVICTKADTTVVGYLTKISPDGTTLYMAPNGNFVEFTPDGQVQDRAGGSCSGKSLTELREAGQAIEFPK
ncbi:hypothetical protein DS909_03205 [Phaeobacter gallaeciensis]|uniref:Uncharacterized protein n=2 Tax=Roseobacteraceae TaxID=2854170 RepID=A0A366XCI7_9RHOB|nr:MULTISPECIES: hypothetical protein [Roseobacteraceae]MBT3143409.1 hypothetical protein [Falsiruegeria litorea]MBT8169764.1 hypothetical protein [Falsiruegeria litorea]RBW60870.1 hypothetical protein DS909_03205 [Phaeobacter gallaeciensis]